MNRVNTPLGQPQAKYTAWPMRYPFVCLHTDLSSDAAIPGDDDSRKADPLISMGPVTLGILASEVRILPSPQPTRDDRDGVFAKGLGVVKERRDGRFDELRRKRTQS